MKSNFPDIVFWIFLLIVSGGGALAYYVGADRVPLRFKPLANAWLRAGYDPKWITIAIRTAFALSVILFFVVIGYFMLDAAHDLGTPRP